MDLEPIDGGDGTRVTMTEYPQSGPIDHLPPFVLDVVTNARNAWSLRRLARLGERRVSAPPASGS